MSRKYKFGESTGAYFISFATVYWIDVFYAGYVFFGYNSIFRLLQKK